MAFTHDGRKTTEKGGTGMRVGIYGGTFNPIHHGHIALGRQFLMAADLDQVWYVVSPQNPFKVGERLLDDDQRLLMVERALENEPQLLASDYEFHLPKPSYMWHTLQSMSHTYPDVEFTLLIGGDNWTRFHHWYHYEDILAHYRIAVYPRQDDPIDPATLPENVMLVSAELLDISSTEIRRLIREDKPYRHLVPTVVADLIEEKGWYAKE
jgi:nicotinate-nucleotide adenylyltransferase